MKYLLLLLLGFPLKSEAYTVKKPLPIDTAEVGFYIDDIYDINYVKGTYRINLFVWVTSTTVKYNFNEFLDVHHVIDKKIELVMMDSSNLVNGHKLYWSEARLNLEVLQSFDIRRFPFDKQNINLGLEFTYNDPIILKLNLSKKSSIIPKFIPNDWRINSYSYSIKPIHYNTNFGDISVSNLNFNVLYINYSFLRESFTLFLKIFIALFICFLIACSSLFLPNNKTESKFSIIVGGLFGAITNKYITDSFLPINNIWDLSDKIHTLTIVYLLLISLYTIYEQRNKIKDDIKKDLIFFSIIVISYSLFIFYFLNS